MASGASGDPSPPAPVPSDEEEGVEKVEPGDLSDELMKCKLLRKRIKEKGFMTRWVVKEAIGIPSVQSHESQLCCSGVCRSLALPTASLPQDGAS